MKKVLFLVTQSEMGGAQRYVFEVAKALADKNEILVAAGEGDGELFQKLKNTRVQPVYLKRMGRTPWPWQAISAVKKIVDLLKKERPDVLFLCSTTAGLLGSMAGFLYRLFEVRPPREVGPRLRIIYRIGGWAFRDPRAFWKNWLILWMEKITAPLKDKIIVNSEIDRRLAIKHRIAKPEKVVKIYNGIDPNSLDFFSRQQARSSLKLSFNKTVVGTVANFYKTKGLEYLIGAFAGSDLPRRQAGLIVIGEGKERPKLEALIKKYNLQNKVILAGRIPDAYKYLKAFDIFVLPSLKEGFPWIILEAMAAEIPIVATKVGALPEIIDDAKEGLLVEPKNSEALAEKIKWLAEHQKEAAEMASRAKQKVIAQFPLSKMIEATRNEL